MLTWLLKSLSLSAWPSPFLGRGIPHEFDNVV